MKYLLVLITLFTQTAMAENIPIGPEFVPNFSELHEDSLIVPEGETVVIDSDTSVHSIWVAGHLKLARNKDFTLDCVNIQVAETGWLDIGTADDEVTGNDI